MRGSGRRAGWTVAAAADLVYSGVWTGNLGTTVGKIYERDTLNDGSGSFGANGWGLLFTPTYAVPSFLDNYGAAEGSRMTPACAGTQTAMRGVGMAWSDSVRGRRQHGRVHCTGGRWRSAGIWRTATATVAATTRTLAPC